MEYTNLVTQIVVLPKGKPIFSEYATEITVADEAGGAFLKIKQSTDENNQVISLTKEEWPSIVTAVETLLKTVATLDEGQKN